MKHTDEQFIETYKHIQHVLDKYYPKLKEELSRANGAGCTCHANYSGECGCPANWDSKEEILWRWFIDGISEDDARLFDLLCNPLRYHDNPYPLIREIKRKTS